MSEPRVDVPATVNVHDGWGCCLRQGISLAISLATRGGPEWKSLGKASLSELTRRPKSTRFSRSFLLGWKLDSRSTSGWGATNAERASQAAVELMGKSLTKPGHKGLVASEIPIVFTASLTSWCRLFSLANVTGSHRSRDLAKSGCWLSEARHGASNVARAEAVLSFRAAERNFQFKSKRECPTLSG
jgi:hypothetical protein